MLKRSTGVKFHAKEFLKREAINVFTEIWVSPFYTWNLSTFMGEISPLLHPPFNRCFQICWQSSCRSDIHCWLLVRAIMIILAYSQQTNVLRTQILHHSTQYRHRKCHSFDLPFRCITPLSCECRPFHDSAAATFSLFHVGALATTLVPPLSYWYFHYHFFYMLVLWLPLSF